MNLKITKGHGLLSFAKNIGSKNLSSKYSQKSFDYAKQSTTDALKTTSKWRIQKTKKQLKQLMIWLTIKLLIKLQKLGTNETETVTYVKR